MKLQLKMCSYLKAIPYKLNDGTGRVEMFSSSWENYLWICNVSAEFIYATFIYFRLYQVLTNHAFDDLNKIHLVIHAVWTAGISISVATHIAVWHRKEELANFINRFLLFIETMEASPTYKSWSSNSLSKANNIELLLQIFPITPWITVWTNFFTVFFFHHLHNFQLHYSSLNFVRRC